MKRWKKITYMVAIYKLLVELRPLDPYLTAFLTGPSGRVSLTEVANLMEALKSYSTLAVTIIVLIVSDYLKYKPVIVATALCSFISYVLMLGSPSLFQLRVSMIIAGGTYGSHMLTYSYLFYQIEDQDQFQISTGTVASAWQLGKFLGDIIAQTTVYFNEGSSDTLPYITTVAMLLALIWACFLPSVKRKDDFPEVKNVTWSNEKTGLLKNEIKNMTEHHQNNIIIFGDNEYESNKLIYVLKELWINFKSSFSNKSVLKRTFWYLLGTGAQIQVINNINVLYTYVVNKQGNDEVSANGLAESMVTLCGAVSVYLTGRIRLDWNYYGDAFIGFWSTVMGIILISCYFYDHIIYIYVSYILYGILIQAVMLVNIVDMVKHLNRQCYCLILGLNYFGAVIVSNLLTLLLIQFNFLDITIPGRFLFIGGLLVFLGVVFLLSSILESGKKKN